MNSLMPIRNPIDFKLKTLIYMAIMTLKYSQTFLGSTRMAYPKTLSLSLMMTVLHTLVLRDSMKVVYMSKSLIDHQDAQEFTSSLRMAYPKTLHLSLMTNQCHFLIMKTIPTSCEVARREWHITQKSSTKDIFVPCMARCSC